MSEQFNAVVDAELQHAYRKHGRDPWGKHEFYAVLREEVDELWDAIKADRPMADVLAEVAQIACVCRRYAETGDRYKGPHPALIERPSPATMETSQPPPPPPEQKAGEIGEDWLPPDLGEAHDDQWVPWKAMHVRQRDKYWRSALRAAIRERDEAMSKADNDVRLIETGRVIDSPGWKVRKDPDGFWRGTRNGEGPEHTRPGFSIRDAKTMAAHLCFTIDRAIAAEAERDAMKDVVKAAHKAACMLNLVAYRGFGTMSASEEECKIAAAVVIERYAALSVLPAGEGT